MANKNLFEQAIADAKSIREAAFANAKLALEENLTEGVKEMLAEKLKALEEEAIEEEVDVEETVEEAVEETVEETVAEGEDESMEEEVVAEAEEDEIEAEEEPAEEDEIEDDSEEVEDEMEDSEEVDSEVEDMSIEDLKDLIRDVLAQEMGEADEDEADMEVDLDAPAEEPVDMEGGEEEEVDLEELLSELTEGEMDEEMEEANDMNAQGNQDVAEGEMEEGDYMEEDVLGEGLALDVAQALQDMGIEGVTLGMANAVMIAAGMAGVFGAAGIATWAEKNANKINQVITKLGGSLKHVSSQLSGRPEPKDESMKEALEAIENLQEELNEVNLLNAKLLYLNKIFKATSLTESQKANTIAAFDKAETVKEVKLVFETVNTNLNSTASRKSVNEVKGMASKAAGNAPKKPEVLNEGVSEQVLRMQKLAGIIK